jgi:hypothetical protein
MGLAEAGEGALPLVGDGRSSAPKP